MIKFSEFCPKDCVRLSNEDPKMHEGCLLLEAVVLPTPYSAIFFGKTVTVVGFVGDKAFIEEVMDNGQTSRSTVDRDRVARP